MTHFHALGIAVLGAGHGSRLAPFTTYVPKPLLPFRGRTLLDRLLDRFHAQDLSHELAINAHHLYPVMAQWHERYVSRGHEPSIQLVHESTLTGSGGGIRTLTRAMPNAEHVLVHNADILADVDLCALVEQHLRSDACATLLTVASTHAEGNIRVSDDARHITALPGHHRALTAPMWIDTQTHARTFGGIAVFKRTFIETMPPIAAPCVVRDLLAPALAAGAPIAAYDDKNDWHDLGTPTRLFDALRTHGSICDPLTHAFPDAPSRYLTTTVTLSDGQQHQRFVPMPPSRSA